MSGERIAGSPRHGTLQGAFVGGIVIALIVVAEGSGLRLDTPPPILAVPVIIAAYWGGMRAGLISAVLLLLFVAMNWRLPGESLAYSTDMALRLGALAVGLPLAAVLVGVLKHRATSELARLAASEQEMRRLHQELSEVLASRNRILDQSLDVICTVDAAGHFVLVSAASTKVWGYEPSELVGRKYMDLVHPDDHERTNSIASKILSGIATVDFINRYIRKDGSVRHVMWSSRWSEADQLMYAVARDYTEQQEVDDERARYVAIIEATTDLVGMSWSGGRITYLNKAGRDMLGIAQDEDLSDVSIDEVYSDWAAALLSGHAADEALDHGVWSGESALCPRGGTPIPVSQIVLAHRRAEGEVEFMSTIARDISTIKVLEAKLREEASTDELTGLFNRRHFMERFGAAVHSAKRRGHALSFAICDIDGFKAINDEHGHPLGDRVIKAVADILAEEVRGEDVVGRYGGDEFCIMFPHVAATDASACLERIRVRIRQLVFDQSGTPVVPTMTFGIADLDAGHTRPEMLLEAADEALYRAKRAGRDRVEIGS